MFLGPPGAGKGTQAVTMAGDLGMPHVSTGDLLRRALREGTEVGIRAKSFMDAGDLVPDEVLLDLVRGRLTSDDAAGGCVLDGYPRNLAQAESLDEMLRELGAGIVGVLNLSVSEETLVGRIAGRRSDESRVDDAAETVRNRMRVYEEQTAPLVVHYRSRGLLLDVDGEPGVEEVRAAVRSAVAAAS
ncbi:MAG: adenylate kinase [Gemmatimonadota bacterium]|nr:adenylate kinase [Gemmatimonadota bacterium]